MNINRNVNLSTLYSEAKVIKTFAFSFDRKEILCKKGKQRKKQKEVWKIQNKKRKKLNKLHKEWFFFNFFIRLTFSFRIVLLCYFSSNSFSFVQHRSNINSVSVLTLFFLIFLLPFWKTSNGNKFRYFCENDSHSHKRPASI